MIMKNTLIGAGIAGALLIGGYTLLNSTENSSSGALVSTPYYGISVASNTSFACKTLVSAGIFADVNSKVVEGDVSEGTDTVALQIKDENTLIMSTAASISAGMAEGDEMRILENDAQKLTAVWYGSDVNGVISGIVLNKTNGLAVWTKGNSDFALLGVPSGTINYLTCI